MSDQEALHTFPPAAAASAIDITPTSIRRWSEYHRLYLSAGANPPAGENRRYTWQDVETLRKIKELRDKGLGTDAINLALAEAIKNVNKKVSTELAVESRQDSPDEAGLAPAAIVAISAIQGQIAALQASVNEYKQIQRDRIQDLMTGAVIALLAVLIIIVIVDFWAK